MTPLFVNSVAEARKAVKGLWRMTTYEEISESRYGLSLLLKHNPDAIIVCDTPNRPYVKDFAALLARTERLPCDLPGSPFVMKKTPLFIFVWDDYKRASVGQNF